MFKTDNMKARITKVVDEIRNRGIDITAKYDEWMLEGFALGSLGEEGREAVHTISSMHPEYDRDKCNAKFDNILATARNTVSIGSFFDIAKRYGIDISMPKGRPRKTEQQREEEAANKMQRACDFIAANYQLRYNEWTKRCEICGEKGWVPINDREFHSIYCEMKLRGINLSENDLQALLSAKHLIKSYDAVREYLDSLPEWTPDEGDDVENERFSHDPIREFFEHIQFADEENHEFYIHFMRKWFVGLVGLMLGIIDEHNLMIVLSGTQHIGKTFFARHILPPELRDYLYQANPSQRVDKDFVISLSEFILVFLDEFSFGSNAKSDAYKFITTSTTSNERDSYARFRERRTRRAALIAATNNKRYIKDAEGSRRYLSVDVAGTQNIYDHPLPYARAYAMAKYLLEHGYKTKPTAEESAELTRHNEDYTEINDCDEVIRSFFRAPFAGEQCRAYSAGEIMQMVRVRGFYGKGFNAVEIGRTLKRLGYQYYVIHSCCKYLIVEKNADALKSEGFNDALTILHAQEASSKHVTDDANEEVEPF